MNYSAYPDYKESGVQWLGKVPGHWEVKRLSYMALLKSGDSITSEQIAEGGEYPVFGGNGLRGYYPEFTHEGTYILIGRQGALCGNINYASGRFWASEHAVVVNPLSSFAVKWLGELLYAMNLNQYSVSAAQPGLSVSQISSLKIPVPPAIEQTAIADFLDRETGRIDTLAAKKRRLVALLKEQRTALISCTVTRGLPEAAAREFGLEPHTSFKGSGIEWLGEVPEGWEVVPIFRITKTIQTGPFGSQLHSADYIEGGIPLVNPAHIRAGKVVPDELSSVDEMTAIRLSRHRLRDSDIVMGRRGEIGRCAVIGSKEVGWLCGTGSLVVRLRNTSAAYFASIISGAGFSNLLELNAVGTTMLNLNPTIVGRMLVPVPPLPEQTAIATYLDRETTKIDQLIEKVEAAIARLQEYRTALITAAVTGKIDVREPATEKEVA